jgi:hypothetical protein
LSDIHNPAILQRLQCTKKRDGSQIEGAAPAA